MVSYSLECNISGKKKPSFTLRTAQVTTTGKEVTYSWEFTYLSYETGSPEFKAAASEYCTMNTPSPTIFKTNLWRLLSNNHLQKRIQQIHLLNFTNVLALKFTINKSKTNWYVYLFWEIVFTYNKFTELQREMHIKHPCMNCMNLLLDKTNQWLRIFKQQTRLWMVSRGQYWEDLGTTCTKPIYI
jgi:hypothetical protein